jgi:hypothetical protein
MNLFHLYDAVVGKTVGDANFTLAVLQQAQNSTRLVQAGNHALNNPLPTSDLHVYAQMPPTRRSIRDGARQLSDGFPKNPEASATAQRRRPASRRTPAISSWTARTTGFPASRLTRQALAATPAPAIRR